MSGRVVTFPSRTDPRSLAERRQAQATRPDTSAWVSASAGSGKTTVLTNRVLALLLSGTPANRILCLTFTKAAAAEMANRIARRLSTWVTAEDDALSADVARLMGTAGPATVRRARRLFAEVLETPGGLQISTLHAFCQSLLRRFPLEAGVAPHFTLIDERDADEALARALEDTLAAAAQDPGLGAAMAVISDRVHEMHFGTLMREMIMARAKLARLIAAADGKVEGAIARLARRLSVAAAETDADVVAAACADDAFARADLARAAAALLAGSDSDGKRGAVIAAWLETADRAAGFDAYTRAFLTAEGTPRKVLATKQACKACADAPAILLAEAERLVAVAEKRRAVEVCLCSGALLRIGAHVIGLYTAEKAHRNWIDYDDLIQQARRLLERPDFAAWVLYKLDGGIDHVLVDEAQDTNPDQWAILRAITAEFFAGEGARATTRTVFAVGDRKQSIYSFQGAAPDEFDRMHDVMRAAVEDASGAWESVELNVSFRSVPAVLQAVDAVFATPGARAGVVRGDAELTHLPARQGAGGLVEIWPLVVPGAESDPAPWKPPVDRVPGDVPELRLAGIIAERIATMVGRECLEARGRTIRAGDIMILVRRRTAFLDELVRRLKQAKIAVAGVDRMVLTEQLAVMDLIALGRFLLLPQDDLTLATVLKGPLVGLAEDELFMLAYDRGGRRLWDVLKTHAGSASSPFGAAHALLSDLLARVDYVTPAELYGHVLVAGEGRRKILTRLGEEANDPLDEFLRLALAYQETHPPSLEGFLHWLERGQAEIKRDLDQTGTDAVRVITVHGAKGLQAPIVFLPDTAQPPTATARLLWSADDPALLLWPPRKDADDSVCRAIRDAADLLRDEEYRRLLYVAMTRAEDRLYVCGWQGRRSGAPEKTWYGMICGGLDGLATPADDAFLAKHGLGDGQALRLHTPQVDPVDQPEAAPIVVPTAPLQAWALTPAPAEETPPRPLAPSQASRPEPPAASPFGEGPTRFQRGLIIHRLLQSLPELPAARRRAAAEAFVTRPSWRLDPTTQAAIVAETLAVIETPAFAPLFGPDSRAEVPIVGLIGTYAVSGQVDRLAVTADEVLIVDYKTNRPPPRRAADVDAGYVFQMAVYRAALAAIYPGHRIRCLLLWTDGPFTMEIPPAALDAALAPLAS